jgi:hypothetical protein
VAVHLSDSFVIEKLASTMHLLDEDNDEDCGTALQNAAHEIKQESTNGATHCTLQLIGNEIEVTWQSAMENHLLTWDADVARFVPDHYMSTDNQTTIHCCTEYMHNKLMMHCHPSYQGDGPWFDWVSVHFESCTFNGVAFPEGNYPCKVMAIVPKQHNSFLEETAVIVCSAQARTGNDSVLFAEWQLCDGYHIVELSSILESLFVLELGSNRIAAALSYSEWPSCFTKTSY